MDGTIAEVHPDGAGARKNDPQAIGKSRREWTTGIYWLPRMPERRRYSRRFPDKPIMYPRNAGRSITRETGKGNRPC